LYVKHVGMYTYHCDLYYKIPHINGYVNFFWQFTVMIIYFLESKLIICLLCEDLLDSVCLKSKISTWVKDACDTNTELYGEKSFLRS
jgi:hypothetical protein